MNSRRIPFPDNDTLWQDVCALYGREGAMHRCLRVQDTYGLCITLLLLAVALGRRGIAVHEGALPQVRARVQQQYYGVIAPLRTARRGMEDCDSRAYAEAKQLELSLERNLLDAVADIFRGRALWNAEEAIYRNIDLVLDAHGENVPDAAFAAAGNLGKMFEGE